MDLEERIRAFGMLGERIGKISQDEFEQLAIKIENNNNWFTKEHTKEAFNAWAEILTISNLNRWLLPYQLSKPIKMRDIGVLMAGNIPAVGFHDVLSVLVSGHFASVKLSSSDTVSIQWLLGQLVEIEPKFHSRFSFEEMLKGKDAYIATGSDNSARYFDYYFGKYPNIIRKNRTSVAILNGRESQKDLKALGKDIFQYFGMGCRNVSKLFVPKNANLETFLESINDFQFMASHHKYLNNYDYNKSIFLVNQEEHLDNGFLLLKESKELVSPIAVLYYEYFDDLSDLEQKLEMVKGKIQCVVSKDGWIKGSLDLGTAQCPNLEDYADGIDTIEFLKNLD